MVLFTSTSNLRLREGEKNVNLLAARRGVTRHNIAVKKANWIEKIFFIIINIIGTQKFLNCHNCSSEEHLYITDTYFLALVIAILHFVDKEYQ